MKGPTRMFGCCSSLRRMFPLLDPQSSILNPDTAAALHPYRAFRHFFHHAYGVDLVWDKMASKIENSGAMFARFETDIRRFIAFLQAAAAE